MIGESGSGKITLALAIAGLLPGKAQRLRADRLAGPRPRAGQRPRHRLRLPGPRRQPRPGHAASASRSPRSSARILASAGAPRADGGRADRPRPFARAAALAAAYPHQLSGGQRQRIAIAAAIAAGPKLLIADEPTSALDTIVQAEIVALIDRLVKDDGMSLIFISHDIALASGIADRIAVFRAGSAGRDRRRRS